jgi:YesN/AraC family two-component response regulator
MPDALRVIIVDDSKVVLRQLQMIVDASEGVELVATAGDGASAIRSINHHKPDLVLMDIVMPNMDGISALRVIGVSHPEIRIAMVTSVGGVSNHAEEALRLGAFQVISKPFEPQQIQTLFEAERVRRDRIATHAAVG